MRHFLIHSSKKCYGTTVTNKNGALTELSDYYPYGSTRIDWHYTPGDIEQLTYAGTEYDRTTLLSYMQAQYYDGGRGQFTSQDPVFWEGSGGEVC